MAQKLEVLDYTAANKCTQTDVALHFGKLWPKANITRTTISRWIKKEEELRELARKAGSSELNFARRQTSVQPDLMHSLAFWLQNAARDGVILTEEVIRTEYKKFASLLEIPEDQQLKCSNGWIESFKKRHGLRQITMHGEAASVDTEAVATERLRLLSITSEFALKDIYNCDETALFWA